MTSLDRELENIYCECRQQLFTCALAITRSPALAEDAVHDAFCQVLRQNQQPADLKAYVFRSVRNAALDQVRGRASHNPQLLDSILDSETKPAQSAEDAEFRQQIDAALVNLSTDERETIVNHLFGELTFQQIAWIRERPLGTVVSWYRRGLEKLRTELRAFDGTF